MVGVRIRVEKKLKLYRKGQNPVLRGLANIRGERSAHLWTRGWTPRIQTYPGREVPNPLVIDINKGQADINVVLKNILASPNSITTPASSGTIPPPGPGLITRAVTNFVHFPNAHLLSATMTINSLVTYSPAITEVVAHEFGHTMGLDDCLYPVCVVHTTVMEAAAPVGGTDPQNQLIGLPGPACGDLVAMVSYSSSWSCPCDGNPCGGGGAGGGAAGAFGDTITPPPTPPSISQGNRPTCPGVPIPSTGGMLSTGNK